jgi:hypothetical protein
MGRAIGTKIFRIFLCLIGVGVAGAVCLTVGWATGEFLHVKLSHPEKATTQAIAQRFPESRSQLNNSRQGTLLAGLMQAKQQQIALFTPDPSVPADSARLSDGPLQAALSKTFGPDWPQPQSKPSVTAARRARPNALLDDSQIASIKQRLNLTPPQERMWPAVEAELRKLAFAQPPQPPHQNGVKATAPATFELSSADLERLNKAAKPLILSFSDDQKDELRTMARITGLEKFAP